VEAVEVQHMAEPTCARHRGNLDTQALDQLSPRGMRWAQCGGQQRGSLSPQEGAQLLPSKCLWIHLFRVYILTDYADHFSYCLHLGLKHLGLKCHHPAECDSSCRLWMFNNWP
jgi:hypothetical protein